MGKTRVDYHSKAAAALVLSQLKALPIAGYLSNPPVG